MKSVTFDRRWFLKLAGCASVAAVLPVVSPAIGLAGLGRGLKVAQENRMMMGTVVGITVVDPSAARAQQALGAAFERMARLTPLFDRHGSGGVLTQFNQAGRMSAPPPELDGVLQVAQKVHLASGGAFDITVAPLLDAFRRAHAQGGLPPRAEIKRCLATVGGFRYGPQGLLLTHQGAGITLDGVAKGFLADQGLKAAAAAGATRVLINAGGDVAVLGQRDQGTPWKVAVADPQDPRQADRVVAMSGGALATSGNYEVYFDRERLYHHIIDPNTGRSPRADLSVSVRAPSAILADAMSTACFVMQPAKAMTFLRGQGLEGMILTRNHQRYLTPAFGA